MGRRTDFQMDRKGAEGYNAPGAGTKLWRASLPMDYIEYRIVLPNRLRQPLIIALIGAGALGAKEDASSISVYVPCSIDRRDIMAQIDVFRELLERSGSNDHIAVYELAVVEQDWNALWKKNFIPIDIGDRFTILPPWERCDGKRFPLVIDPGMAFGTGHHETTRSCVILMERYARPEAGSRFLDIGTGTGLLAIAALRLGFRYVEAIDHDEQAVAAARTNLSLNGAEIVRLHHGDIAKAGEGYDMITANLISGTLLALAPEIALRLSHGGIAILSGILLGQEEDVINSTKRSGLELRERLVDGKWVSLVVQRS